MMPSIYVVTLSNACPRQLKADTATDALKLQPIRTNKVCSKFMRTDGYQKIFQTVTRHIVNKWDVKSFPCSSVIDIPLLGTTFFIMVIEKQTSASEPRDTM